MQKTPDDFAWAFGRQTYSDFDSFLAEFSDYNREVMKIESPIDDFPLSDTPSIVLQFEGVPFGEEDYDELSLTISSRDGSRLSFLEFMYLANNAVHPYLCNADHVFFEGVSLEGEENGTPVYWMMQGS